MMHIAQLLEDFSVEITAKDIDAVAAARPSLPAGTRVNVTFLGNEEQTMRIAAAATVGEAGLIAVPHISARWVASEASLHAFLQSLQSDETSDHLFVVAGDPAQTEGPYEDAAALLISVPLTEFGVQTVSIAGYPEGHPDISGEVLWGALHDKAVLLKEQGISGDIVTQFTFDVDPVLEWIAKVRAEGIDLPIRIGVPGPTGVKRLLGYARRFGVSSSAGIAKKYGFSITNLLSTAGPDAFITELAARLDPEIHGIVRLHFYTFGGLRATAEWIHEFASRDHAVSAHR